MPGHDRIAPFREAHSPGGEKGIGYRNLERHIRKDGTIEIPLRKGGLPAGLGRPARDSGPLSMGLRAIGTGTGPFQPAGRTRVPEKDR